MFYNILYFIAYYPVLAPVGVSYFLGEAILFEENLRDFVALAALSEISMVPHARTLDFKFIRTYKRVRY